MGYESLQDASALLSQMPAGVMRMSIGPICNREVVVAQMTESLHMPAELMHAWGVVTIAGGPAVGRGEGRNRAPAHARGAASSGGRCARRLNGIVSLDDLLELIAEELDAVARLIRRQHKPPRLQRA